MLTNCTWGTWDCPCPGGWSETMGPGWRKATGIPMEWETLFDLLRGLEEAQATDTGWQHFKGKYIAYPHFAKEWWLYRRTYHAHVRDELVCQTLKDKCLLPGVKIVEGDIEDWGHSGHLLQQQTGAHGSESRTRGLPGGWGANWAENEAPYIWYFHSYFVTYGACKNW